MNDQPKVYLCLVSLHLFLPKNQLRNVESLSLTGSCH